jgi:prolipoprotein diacylglyceryltransferase
VAEHQHIHVPVKLVAISFVTFAVHWRGVSYLIGASHALWIAEATDSCRALRSNPLRYAYFFRL